MSKLNLMFVFGLLPFLIQNYWFGFGMVLFFMAVAKLAGKFQTFFKLYWKVLLLFGVFLFLVKAAFSPGEHVLYQLGGICVTTESIADGLNIVSLVLAFSGAFILFSKTTPMEDLTYSLEKKGVSHVVSFIILSSSQTIKDWEIMHRLLWILRKQEELKRKETCFRGQRRISRLWGL